MSDQSIKIKADAIRDQIKATFDEEIKFALILSSIMPVLEIVKIDLEKKRDIIMSYSDEIILLFGKQILKDLNDLKKNETGVKAEIAKQDILKLLGYIKDEHKKDN